MKTSKNNLFILGLIGLTVGFLTAIDGYVYGYSFFSSISESATTPLTTSMILPFCLGAMCVFFLGYSGYDTLDWLLTKVMAVGAFIVAMCPCRSAYITEKEIGLFKLDLATSNLAHYLGACLLFAAYLFWVGIQFRKTDKFFKTKKKQQRDNVYMFCLLLSLFGFLTLFFGAIKVTFIENYIWLGETLALVPLSIAVIIKSGIILKDK